MPALPILFNTDTTLDKVKTLATVQLCLGLFLADSSSAVSILGLTAIAFNNTELLGLYLVFCPLSILSDFLWLGRHHHGGFIVLLAIIQLLVKLAATYFTYDIYSNAQEDGLGEYQSFGGGGQRDPFNRGGGGGGGGINTATTTMNTGGGVNGGGGGGLSPVGYTPPPPGAMPDEPPSPTGMPPPQQQQQQQEIGASLL